MSPGERHFIDVESGKAVGVTEYARQVGEARADRAAEASVERVEAGDPAIAAIEAALERTADELRDTVARLESARRQSHEGNVMAFALPGESPADSAKRVAAEFAAKVGPLEDRVKALRSRMERLQGGLDALRESHSEK